MKEKHERVYTHKFESYDGSLFIYQKVPMNYTIEIRTLTLKPGTRDKFHHLYIHEALPLPNAGTSMLWRMVRPCMMRTRIT